MFVFAKKYPKADEYREDQVIWYYFGYNWNRVKKQEKNDELWEVIWWLDFRFAKEDKGRAEKKY